MNELRKTAEMALEALIGLYETPEFAGTKDVSVDRLNRKRSARESIAALRQALAQEQEPFEYWNAVEGWVKIDEVRQHLDLFGCGTIYKTPGENRVPLYTAPPKREWIGLTDEEMEGLWDRYAHMEMMRAIEAKLKEKNESA